jgi:nicotinate-nucleotide--dimethylbenzimidazole phosphoribosyltransferase
MSLTVVLGGTRSGKSSRAEVRARAIGGPVVYVATGAPTDPEMAERVRIHRERRPDAWTTVETVDVVAALADVDDAAVVLVDDLEGWLVDRMTAHGLWADADVEPLGDAGLGAHAAIVAEARGWASVADRRAGDTILVAGQTGWGPTPPSASTRRWLDLHGDVLQVLLGLCDHAELVVGGRALPLPARPVAQTVTPAPADLGEHGDTQVPPGSIDLAVNVLDGPPTWLHDRLVATLATLRTYPDQGRARARAGRRHGRPPGECLLLDGAAEGFWLLAQVLRPRHAVCVHPSFTEGERALRAAGFQVARVFRLPGDDWRLDVDAVPDDADLVVLGRPDNPTGVLDPEPTIAGLCRPGRTVVVDEAFADFLDDAGGLADRRDLPGLVVLRSLTKIWGLAGLRVGYLLGPPDVVSQLEAARQPWPVNTLALAAIEACLDAEEERRRRAAAVAADRRHLVEALAGIDGVRTWPTDTNFVLLQTPLRDLRDRLLTDRIAVRRGETFPGLDPSYVRVAVRSSHVTDQLVAALGRHLLPEPPMHIPDTVLALIDAVLPVDEDHRRCAQERSDGQVKPPGSLGRLETLGAQLAAIAGTTPPPPVYAPALVIAAADHGVHARGVTPWPQEITAAMVGAFCADGAAANAIAGAVGAQVSVLDVGVAGEVTAHPRLRQARVRPGTRDLSVEDAMTPGEAEAAVLAGTTLARELIDDGADLLVLGDMGIANTTASAALIAGLTGSSPATVTGRGTGIDDTTLERKTAVVAEALARVGSRSTFETLAGLGGLEHAALVGVCLAGAAARVPVVLDGVITNAAALVACAMCPSVTGYLIAGHRSVEPGATVALKHLGLEPIVDLDLRLGEGTGGLLAVPVVRAAAAALREMLLLADIGARPDA